MEWLDADCIRPMEETIIRFTTGKVLDFGCGRGVAMRRFLSYGWEVVGLDISQESLKSARKYGETILGDGERLPIADNVFDIVVSYYVLHHTKSPSLVLSEIQRCLKRGGILLLAEVTEDNPFHRILRRLHPVWEGVTVRSKFSRVELKFALRQAGFEILDDRTSNLFSWIVIAMTETFQSLRKISSKAYSLLQRLEVRMPQNSHLYYFCVALHASVETRNS